MLQIKHAIQILNKLKITSNYAQGVSTYITCNYFYAFLSTLNIMEKRIHCTGWDQIFTFCI